MLLARYFRYLVSPCRFHHLRGLPLYVKPLNKWIKSRLILWICRTYVVYIYIVTVNSAGLPYGAELGIIGLGPPLCVRVGLLDQEEAEGIKSYEQLRHSALD